MNSSPSTTTSDLHRKILDLLLHHPHDMQHVLFDTIPRSMPFTDLVVYQGGDYNYEFQQFLSIITFAALVEYIQDPDPPEIRQVEQQQLVDQLELENDSLYMAMEDAQYELERVQRNYLKTKQRFNYLSNGYTSYQQTQDLLLLTLGQQYSDLQLEYASLQSDVDDYQIMNQQQLINRDDMVQGLLQERQGLQMRQSDAIQKVIKLQTKLDTYQVALASKDLKLFQLVEERDSLKQQIKLKENQVKLEALLLSNNNNNNNNNNNHSTHSSKTTSTTATTSISSTTSTTTTASADSNDDDEESSSTEQAAPIKTTAAIITTTSSPNRGWIQTWNHRIRPSKRRSPKVQPLTPKKEIEHSK